MTTLDTAAGTTFDEREVEISGLALRLAEAGDGPPLIVLPGDGGFFGSKAQELLARRLRTVTVRAAPGAATARALGGAIPALASRLGLDTFAVLGIGDGAAAAAWAAIDAGSRAEVLVLASPDGISLSAVPRPPAETTSQDDELAARLAHLPAAKLVLIGSWDTVLPRDAVSRFRAALSHCHAILVYGADHAVAESRPEAFADVVSDFVERRDQFVVARESVVINP